MVGSLVNKTDRWAIITVQGFLQPCDEGTHSYFCEGETYFCNESQGSAATCARLLTFKHVVHHMWR